MITRFVLKDAHVPAEVVETMERRIHQRMDAYFKDEAEGDTVIGVRITEQKNTYKVEMTMPYMGHTLRTENQEREISLPALDKGIDVLERQMKKLRTRLGRDLRKKPTAVDAAPEAGDGGCPREALRGQADERGRRHFGDGHARPFLLHVQQH